VNWLKLPVERRPRIVLKFLSGSTAVNMSTSVESDERYGRPAWSRNDKVIAKLRDLVICKRFIKKVAKELEIPLLTRVLRAKLVSERFVQQLLTAKQKHHLSVDSTLLECAAAHEHLFKTLSLFPRIMNILKSERFEDVQTVKLNATQLLEIRITEYDRCF
jgi:hypothetical protein